MTKGDILSSKECNQLFTRSNDESASRYEPRNNRKLAASQGRHNRLQENLQHDLRSIGRRCDHLPCH